MCDMPIKKRMTEKRRERGGGGAREYNAVEVEIYSGIGFTRFHQGPIPPPQSLLKNTWCKLTLASRESRGRKEKRAKASVRDRGRHEKRKFQGLPWGLRNVAFRSLDLARLTKLLKTKQKKTVTSPQAVISSSSPAAPQRSHTDLLTLCTCATAWMTANSVLHLKMLVDLIQHNWLTCARALIIKRVMLVCLTSLIQFLENNSVVICEQT